MIVLNNVSENIRDHHIVQFEAEALRALDNDLYKVLPVDFTEQFKLFAKDENDCIFVCAEDNVLSKPIDLEQEGLC